MEADPKRVSELYHQAAARPPAERGAFLQEACDGDDALREEVESLLRYESASSRFLETPAASLTALTSGPSGAVAGQALGPYTIVGPLGAGGMGEVYRARDSRLDRDVAIKILPAAFTSDPERRARFAREARVLATLNHPSIGAIYGLEELDGITALILELVEGQTLADSLERGAMPTARALGIARQIADALDAAHGKGIVHRDLKPANIVLQRASDPASGDLRVKVLDFGLAKSIPPDPVTGAPAHPPASLDGTGEGRILGTPAYMSPEQARGLPVDKRTDIWAFGCVLFEMLSGRPAFDGKTATDTFVRILEHDPDWSALPPTTPERVRTLLRRCLEKDAPRRLRDIGDAVFELEASQTSVRDDPAGLPRRTRGGQSRRWFAAAAILIAASLVAVWFTWLRTGADPAGPPVIRVDIDLGPGVSLGASVARDAGGDRVIGISPGGERLVFLSNGRLETRRLSDAVSVPLAGTEGASSFFFSPDGHSVAFVAERRLRQVPLDGGSATTICEEIPPIRGGTWVGDTIVLGGTGIGGGLLRLPARGGSPEPLLPLRRGEFTQRWPQFLPGGDAVIFTSHDFPGQFDFARIDVVSLAEGQRKTVVERASFGRFVPGPDGTGYLTFLRSGVLFAVAFDPVRFELLGTPFPVLEDVAYEPNLGSAQVDVSASGTVVYRRRVDTTVHWLHANGSTQALPLEPARYSALALSPDGTRLAFGSGGAIWVYDLAREVRTQVATGLRPVWTPDGRFIVFATLENIWWIRADGGTGPQPLLPLKDATWRVPLSIADGAAGLTLAFQEIAVGSNRSWDLWMAGLRVDAAGVRALAPEAFLDTTHDERELRFSPDGRWVAYSSNEVGARPEIYVRAFPDDGRRWQISNGGGTAAQWSKGRPELFFRYERSIMVVPYAVAGGSFIAAKPRVWPPQPVDDDPLLPYDVSPDGRRVIARLADPRAEEQSRHVVSLWTHALAALRRAPVDQSR